MRLQTFWGKVRDKRTLKALGIAAGVVVVFGLGVLTGDGRLRLVPGSQYGDETGLPRSLDYSSLNRVYDTLRANYDGKLSEGQVLDGLKHGLAESINDPYTEYFTPAEAKTFNGQLEGMSLTGIGAELDQDSKGNIVIMSPIDNSPASSAGLQAKDVITTINGQTTAGMSVGDAVNKIRGPKGSEVTLGILRDGTQQLSFTITRNTINVPTATSKVLDNNIGYLQISQFSSDTYDLVRQAADKLQHAGVKKLVLDLRDNPGGEVDSAQNIASLWLPNDALIMQERRDGTVVENYRATGTNPLKGIPTVVLVNGGSASAAEITALALHDAHAATIVGEKSYGKGVVQSVIPFSDGSELKVTIAKWYSPAGTSINKKGITPDETVKLSDDDAKAGNDTQLQAAEDYLNTH